MDKNKDLIEKIQKYPQHFIEWTFTETLWDKQLDIVNSVRDYKYTTVRSCHDAGKSFISARIALWFLYAFKNSKVITTAPTFKQVEDILWREIRSAKTKAKIPLLGKLNQTELDLGEQWFAMGMSTDEPSRFQGFHAEHLLLIVDEAAGVAQDIFDASEGIVSSAGAKVLYIGNPTTIEGEFYKSFRLPDTSKIHISTFDTPNFTQFGITLEDIRNGTWAGKITGQLPAPYLITPEWVADKFLRWGESSPLFQSRVLGEFPEQGEDTLIPLNYIEQATMRDYVTKENDPKQIGVDVARFGSDSTVFLYREGEKVISIKQYRNLDTVESSNMLIEYMGFNPFAEVYVDEIGVGAGVLDRVKKINNMKKVFGVNVGSSPHNKELFFNLRAEIYWALRDRFVRGEIVIPSDDELMAQLANIKFKYTPKGQIQIESKDDMKKRSLPSPDKADALALAFGSFNVRPSLLDVKWSYE